MKSHTVSIILTGCLKNLPSEMEFIYLIILANYTAAQIAVQLLLSYNSIKSGIIAVPYTPLSYAKDCSAKLLFPLCEVWPDSKYQKSYLTC